jgi:hypothetical protein
MVSRVELLAEFGNDDDAPLLYDTVIVTPIGTLRVATQSAVGGRRIKKSRTVQDAHALRAARHAAGQPAD